MDIPVVGDTYKVPPEGGKLRSTIKLLYEGIK